MRVLVDSSVWSLALRRDKAPADITACLFDLIFDKRVELIGMVRLEVLSGFRHQAQYQKLRDFLRDFPEVKLEVPDYETAVEFYNICISKGIQGSHIDLLICAAASRRNWEIFTEDKDFALYQKYLPINLLKLPTA
jgi:predicted nucleic acid-binding protein